RSPSRGARHGSTRSSTEGSSTGSPSCCGGNGTSSSRVAGAPTTASRTRADCCPLASRSAEALSRLALGRRPRPRREPAVECTLEHLVGGVGQDELDLVPRLLGQLAQVGLVLVREDHLLQAGPLGGEHLVANTPDLQHLAG